MAPDPTLRFRDRIEEKLTCRLGKTYCSFSKPDPPAAPDYTGAARAQGENNLATARLQSRTNNPNVFTPYGSRTVNFQGDQPTIRERLSPGQQNIFNANERLQTSLLGTAEGQLGRVGESFNTPWNTTGAPQVAAYDPNAITSTVDDATIGGQDRIVDTLRERYQPEFDRNRQERENQLLIQGHGRGQTAWNTVNQDLNRSENDFRMASILQAGTEQSRLLGEQRANQMQESNLQNIAQSATTADRGRYLAEQAYDRNVPLNELNSLRTGNQIQPYQYQQYQPTNIQAAPLFDATLAGGNFAQQNFQNQSQQYGDFWSGIGQAGAAGAGAFAASDRRLKENIVKIGTAKGIFLYRFNYIDEDTVYEGFMADEVKQIDPDAVIEMDGYLHVSVDYAPVRVN